VFEAETSARDLMRLPPRSAQEPLMRLRHIALSMTEGLIVALAAGMSYLGSLWLDGDSAAARTTAFMVLVVANLMLIFPNRSAMPGWRHQFAGLPRASVLVLSGTLGALALVTQVPLFLHAFGFAPPTLQQWALTLLLGLAALLCFEAAKRGFRRLAERGTCRTRPAH